MKKTLLALLLALIVCVGVAAADDAGVLAAFSERFSVAAMNAASYAEAPEGLNLTAREQEIFALGYAAGYDKLRALDAGGEEMTYVLNTRSMKFHDTLCMGGQSIGESNKEIVTCPRDQLIEEGYSACQICNP